MGEQLNWSERDIPWARHLCICLGVGVLRTPKADSTAAGINLGESRAQHISVADVSLKQLWEGGRYPWLSPFYTHIAVFLGVI